MNSEWGRGGMYETNVTEAEGVFINHSRGIQGVHCLTKYSVLFLLLLPL